jgi:hypothetical protein
MDQGPQQQLNTREFLTLWNVAKEEHLVQRVSAVLARLATQGVLPPMSDAQGAVLSHAIQLAGDPAAGPAVALQFLETLAGEQPINRPGA